MANLGLHFSTVIFLTVLAMIIQAPKTYSSFELKSIGNQVKKDKLQRDVYHVLKDLGICSVKPTRRGRRSFCKSQKAIPVHISERFEESYIQPPEDRTPSLRRVPLVDTCKLPLPTKIGVWNAQSMMNKPTEVCDFVLSEKLDILAITEAWLRGDQRDGPTIASIQNTLQGYRILKLPRKGKRGGGICVILRDQYTCKSRPHLFETFECLEVTVKSIGLETMSMFVIYRPPGTQMPPSNSFSSEFSKLLETVNLLTSHVVICGDFNIHVDDTTKTDTRAFNDLLESAGLKQLVTQPTHSRGHILDLLMVREDDDFVADVTICSSMPSDHAAVIFSAALSKPPIKRKEVKLRKLRSISYESFRNDIQTRFAAENDLDNLTVNEKVDFYNNVLGETLNQHAPVLQKIVQLRPHAPWYDQALKASKQKVRAMERKWRKGSPRSTVDKEEMQKSVAEYNAKVKSAKKAFHQDMISDASTKELFLIVNKLTVEKPGQPLPSHGTSLELTQRFADFFAEKVNQLGTVVGSSVPSSLPSSTSSDSLRNHPKPNCSLKRFLPVTQSDVASIIKSSKVKACPLDPLPAMVFKNSVEVLLPAITDIANQSLETGIFPSSLKSTLVIPTLKKPSLDPEILKNFRPISNLPLLGKLIERIVCKQLMSYLDENSLLASRQSAYRRFHSVETALLRVQNDLLQTLDSKKEAILVLLDLTSAFDTVDHGILLTGLKERFGVTDIAANWLSSYLSNRRHRVLIDEATSDPVDLRWGVPQGSVIGPLLFVCYTTPVQQIIQAHGLSCMMYADDTQLYISMTSDDRTQAIRKLDLCLQEVRTWMGANHLFLNDGKMEVLHVASHMTRNKDIQPFCVREIEPADEVRDLGVVIDRHLSLRRHINLICRRASFALRRLGSIRRLLNQKTTEILIHAFVTSLLDNCNSLLFGVPDKDVSKLQRIQNSAARLVSMSKKYDHITPILKELHWLPIHSRIKYKIILLTFKAVHGLAPTYLSELVAPYQPTRSLRSASHNLLVVNRSRTKTFGDRSFESAAPTLWNSLPDALRAQTNIDVFERELKTHLFNISF